MGFATFLSRILGLVREQVFAFLFGAGNATDAFNIAFRIPNLLRDLFAEGAMSAALVPTFTKVRKEEGDARAWRVAGLVFRVLLGVVGVLALGGILFAPHLVGLYAAAFRSVPGKFELTVRMTRIMFPFFPLVALAAAYMGILNACGKFFLPGFASALFNLTSILTGILGAWLLPRFGQPSILGMAIGVVVGGTVQAFCQLPELYRQGYRWKGRTPADPPWRQDPALRRMLALMIPGMVGLAATQVNVLVNSVLATSQGPGAVSWLNYAFRLMQFPIGIFGVSLAAATLPRVSALWVEKNPQGVADTLTRSLRHVFAVNLPASAGLAFLGAPIIALLFQYGRFGQSDTDATATALAAYSAGLAAYSAVKVLVPACYALGNTRLPVISSVLSVVVTIALNLAMVGPLGFWGLALGTSLAALFNAVFLVVALNRLLREQGGRMAYGPLVRGALGYLALGVAMGVLARWSHGVLDGWLPDGWLQGGHLGAKLSVLLVRAFKVGCVVVQSVGVVLVLGKLGGLSEVSEVAGILVRKFKKKSSAS